MIKLDHLRKVWGSRVAVDDLSLEVETGELFGLLGHNGAGKSTTIGMVLGQVYPTAGKALIGGVDVQVDRAKALGQLGAIFETPSFYDYLSGWRNLEILTSFSGLLPRSELEQAVELVGLGKRVYDPVRTYSHGMRQRLALAQALLPRPKILILDEPSEGLDPEGIHEMRALILRLHRELKVTIIVCSHLLSEVEQMCSRIAILRQSKLLFIGDWQSFRGGEAAARRVIVRTDRTPESLRLLREKGLLEAEGAGPVVHTAENIETVSLTATGTVAAIAETLVGAGHRVEALSPVQRTLEDVYLAAVRGGDLEAVR